MTTRVSSAIIGEWRKLYKKYVGQGLTPGQAFEQIGVEYGRARCRIEYYLVPGRKEYEIRKAKESFLRHPEERKAYWHKHNAQKKRNADLYKALVNSLNMVFEKALSGSEELSQKEIYGRLRRLCREAEYSVPFDTIEALLPVEEVRPGYYRFKKIRLP